MNLINSIFLGVVQGITEFLPISSSGHLVIVQSFISDFSQPGVLFDTFLHAGTLGAVLIYFRHSIFKLKKNELLLYVVGTIPAVFVGFVFSDYIEALFTSTKIVGIFLLVTGLMNLLTHKKKPKKKDITLADSLCIGLFQAIAIVPGISRSGSTIFAATARGIKKPNAAQFSFILSIPAVLGANIYQILSNSGDVQVDFINYFIGFAAALISGYFAIKMVINLLQTNKFGVFAFYCFTVGFLVIFL